MKKRLFHSLIFLAGTICLGSIQAVVPSSSTEIKPRSAFAQTELGRLIEQAHQGNTNAFINALRGEDLDEVVHIFAACVTHDVAPKTCGDLLQSYIKFVKNNHYACVNPYIDNFYHQIIDGILQQAVIDGKVAYVNYFTTRADCREHITLTHLKNAMEKLPACRNGYTQTTMNRQLQKCYAQKLQEGQLNESATSYIMGCPLCALIFNFIFNR
jgi:hypothetical protein